jgi:NhaA family Na+:H+ antiporter
VLEIWKFVHFISAELPEPNLSRDELARSVIDLRKEVSQLRMAHGAAGATGVLGSAIEGRYLGPAMQGYPIDRFRKPFTDLIRNQSNAGVVLFLVAVVAMIWANSPWKESYHHLWEHTVAIRFDTWVLERNLHHWINDGLMAMFFFLVGLELKREIVGGELANPKDAILPVAAGLGGMVVPALIFLGLNPSGPTQDGWGIPMATDIAFAVGLLALLGNKAPLALKVFITTLAIADDLGAVLVIALFYTSDISLWNVGIGAAFLLLLVFGNLLGVRSPWYYAVIGIGGMWTAFLLSGIHATVAGVLAALAIPAVTKLDERTYITKITKYITEFALLKPNNQPTLTADQLDTIEKIDRASENAETPLQRLEHRLQPIVMYYRAPTFCLGECGGGVAYGPWWCTIGFGYYRCRAWAVVGEATWYPWCQLVVRETWLGSAGSIGNVEAYDRCSSIGGHRLYHVALH